LRLSFEDALKDFHAALLQRRPDIMDSNEYKAYLQKRERDVEEGRGIGLDPAGDLTPIYFLKFDFDKWRNGAFSLVKTVDPLPTDRWWLYDDQEPQLELLIAPSQQFASGLLSFFAERLKVQLREQGARHDLVDAVFALEGQDDLLLIVRRVEALGKFLDTDDGKNLLAGFKRAVNILEIEERKDKRSYTEKPKRDLLNEVFEKHLWDTIQATTSEARDQLEKEDFEGAMECYSQLRVAVDAFFDKVKVNVDETAVRENRLNLLNQIREATRSVADLSKVGGATVEVPTIKIAVGMQPPEVRAEKTK
jgi:hypothetical protein